MLQAFIAGNALKLVLDNLLHLVLDAVVVFLHLRLHVAIVAHQLREVLKAQTHRHLVASCRGDEVVQSLEIDGGQLVDDDRRFGFAFLLRASG